MPQKNSIKIYVEKSYYHIYNRGVNKQQIFKDKQDYSVFLNYLKTALLSSPKPEDSKKITVYVKGVSFTKMPKNPKNFNKKIELIAYCLMPNHFHLLIKQSGKKVMENFTRSLLTRYSMYFNKKYERVGHLFQGTYKAVLIDNDSYLLHLSRYIHSNPMEISKNLIEAYSSYANYLGLKNTPWVKTNFILSFFNNATYPEFKKINNYKAFIENYQRNSEEILGKLTLE